MAPDSQPDPKEPTGDGPTAGSSNDELVESLYDAYMDRALDGGEVVDPATFVAGFPELGAATRDVLLERLEAISRLTGLVLPEAGGLHSSPPDPGDELDRRIGEYRLIQNLGGGAMGEVFLAEQSSLGRLVALKTQRSHLALSVTAAARFEREARALGQVNHPSVVRIHDYGQDGEIAFLAMELLPGRSLKERVDTPRDGEPPASPAQITLWGAQIARGLEAVHRVGLVHRDVKPSNLRIVEASDDDSGSGEGVGRAVLVDFGLARLGEASDLSHTGEFLGSPAYASPEQVRGAAELDGRSDVYSLGATLYQALCRQAPFTGDSLEAVLHGVLSREPEPLARLAPGLPRDLCLVVHKAMEKDPGQRYATAAALADDLEAVLELRPVTAKPQGPLGRALRWTRRNRPIAAGFSAAIVAVLAALIFVGESARRDHQATLREAGSMLAGARECLDEFRTARLELQAEEREFDRLWELQEYEHLGPDRSERLVSLDHRVRTARERRDAAFVRGQNLLASAARLDPELADAADAVGAELVLERLLEAQARKDKQTEAFLAAELDRLDPHRELRDAAFPFGGVHLTSSVPGTRAWIFRYRALDELVEGGEARQVPWPVVPATPDWRPLVDGQPLQPGREVLRLAGPPSAELPILEGDLITHLDDHPIAGGPLVHSVAPEPGLGEPAVLSGDRLVELDGRRLQDPLDLETLLLAEPDVDHSFTFEGPPAGSEPPRRVTLSQAGVQANGVRFESLAARAARVGGWARVLHDGQPLELDLPPGLRLRRSLAAPVLFDDGASPLGMDLVLEPGRYLLVSRAPGQRLTRRFLYAEPGTTQTLDVTPARPGDAPEGMLLVANSNPGQADFWMGETEVTSAEYLEFLNEPGQLARVDAGLAARELELMPRVGGKDMSASMWARDAEGRFYLPPDWPADWPVLGVDYHDARAFAAWLTAKRGSGTYHLPSAWQATVAGSGGGVQRYSWGARFDQRFANTCFSRAVARPEPVLANPRDESPHGLYDTCGNALEWITDWYDESRNLRHAIGGSWGQARIEMLSIGGGIGLDERASGGETGFRLSWSPEPGAGAASDG
ncbi:MAG: SUMF1/EgtB/PvdO family nonheme iron enzyme [Planctomycetota bacterium]|nr:SUMF1/EgtB/PvdO family nonheme iron enzyme [Planctomycetota bacterium]